MQVALRAGRFPHETSFKMTETKTMKAFANQLVETQQHEQRTTKFADAFSQDPPTKRCGLAFSRPRFWEFFLLGLPELPGGNPACWDGHFTHARCCVAPGESSAVAEEVVKAVTRRADGVEQVGLAFAKFG